ncbi:MAG TPA: ABC transporter permease [Trebonia sp.]|jgi:peptide/nickel transport system permease protein|nr:ABC transporter permease [Trebonia sp.]
MIRFLIRRIAQAILVLWLSSVAVFLLFFVGPGPTQVARTFAGRLATAARIAQIKHELHLDEPLPVQYGHWLWNLLQGNLGYDYYNGQSVDSVVGQAIPATVSLVIGAAILWLLYGVITGIVSAVRPRTFLDRGFTTSALFFYSVPTFVLGLSLIWLLAYKLSPVTQFFPFHGYEAITANPGKWFEFLILPWLTLALVQAASYTRLTRTSMLEVLNEDYVRTARSKGMSERRVILVHALRSALTPIVTLFGLDVGTLLGGAIITEKLFGITGLGWTIVNAINIQDLPVIMGIAVLAAVFVVVANLIVDITYAFLDPRVRLS